MSNTEEFWYVVKQQDSTCEVVSFTNLQAKTPEQKEKLQWGAFASQQEAIAKKIGLIRAGKCKPQ